MGCLFALRFAGQSSTNCGPVQWQLALRQHDSIAGIDQRHQRAPYAFLIGQRPDANRVRVNLPWVDRIARRSHIDRSAATVQIDLDFVDVRFLAAVRSDPDLVRQLEIQHPVARLDLADVGPWNHRLGLSCRVDAAAPRAPQALAVAAGKLWHAEMCVELAGELAESINAQRLSIEGQDEIAFGVDVVQRRGPDDGAAVIERRPPLLFGVPGIFADHDILACKNAMGEKVVRVEFQRPLGGPCRRGIQLVQRVERVADVEAFPPVQSLLGDDRGLRARGESVAVRIDPRRVARRRPVRGGR